VKQGIASGSLARGDLIMFKLLLTAVSFFRATSPKWAEVKKSTITDPFTGTCNTLPTKSIEEALKSMGWKPTSHRYTFIECFDPLVADFRSAIKELKDSGVPVIPLLYLIPFTYFLVSGANPVRGLVFRRIRKWWVSGSKGGGLFRSKPTIFQYSQKAGPNANLAILGIGIDLVG